MIICKATFASNNEMCDIPFDYDSRDNYFCVDTNAPNDAPQCKTTSDVFADCNIGNKKFHIK